MLGIFIGRPYCRWLCPYGALLGVCSRTARKTVTVMPEDCCDCNLCEKACPFGAIENHAAVASRCVACTRCYKSCPLERQRLGLPVEEVPLPAAATPAPVAAAATHGPGRIPVEWSALDVATDNVDVEYVDGVLGQLGLAADQPASATQRQWALLPILQTIQARHRYLPRKALERVCQRTNLTLAQLLGVATFYNQFRLAPVGEHLVCVCHGTACHVAGAQRITDAVRLHLGLDGRQDTDAQRQFTIQKVACLGCCSLAPVMQIDGVTFGHLSGQSAVMALDSTRMGKVHGHAPGEVVLKSVATLCPPVPTGAGKAGREEST